MFSALAFLALCIPATSGTSLAGNDSFGVIKSVTGEVRIAHAQEITPAAPYMKFMQGDSIKTGKESCAGIIFDDDTTASLGPDSEIVIEDYQFDPAEQKLAFVVRLIKGTFSFITGQIAKLAPKKIKFETPDATLGVRGTEFLVKID